MRNVNTAVAFPPSFCRVSYGVQAGGARFILEKVLDIQLFTLNSHLAVKTASAKGLMLFRHIAASTASVSGPRDLRFNSR
ncbi:hypothetical protein [Mycoplana rhizolycopersici]|uniref:Uncharacterized protein n=1 Tax=Mycoplana rhizolycopersici TaxID=2746702 RepID=A0ABX2QQA1_9HYPH|nr:hypothetical protein [Rhizobium rhizolycopersici]NVP58484.1 hypothetical protein [Rhizobium rhizolycopersici]